MEGRHSSGYSNRIDGRAERSEKWLTSPLATMSTAGARGKCYIRSATKALVSIVADTSTRRSSNAQQLTARVLKQDSE